jgi:hypothetical protein
VNLPENIEVVAGQTKKIQFEKGSDHNPLILYYPQNATLSASAGIDDQSEVVKSVFIKSNYINLN